MMWWRIELDKSGAIKTCEQVELAAKSTSLVRFVEANSKAEACSDVKSWHRRYLEKARERTRSRIESARAKGMCVGCKARPAKAHRSTCQRCLDQTVKRRRDVRNGAPVRVLLTPEQAQAHVRESKERARRNRVLIECLKQFDARGPEAFRAWLVAEIERRSVVQDNA
jgi:hypothetical protein